eukprot:GHVU01108668.1.p3 GENE.GHVU01108668.1~~GHVU01108668.1.p3  ORF type:complete len:115 (-),score=31.68 GHVU01108668.1:103-447(-)
MPPPIKPPSCIQSPIGAEHFVVAHNAAAAGDDDDDDNDDDDDDAAAAAAASSSHTRHSRAIPIPDATRAVRAGIIIGERSHHLRLPLPPHSTHYDGTAAAAEVPVGQQPLQGVR